MSTDPRGPGGSSIPHDQASYTIAFARWRDRGLRYAARTLARYDDYDHLAPASGTHPLARFRDKVVAESAVLFFVAHRRGLRSVEVDAIRRFVEPHAREPFVSAAIRRFPQLAPPLCMAHLLLSRCGFGDEHFDELVTTAFTHPYRDAVELLTFRRAEAQWLGDLRTGSRTVQSFLMSEHSTLARALPSPLYCARSDAYALTHEAMYATTFGDVVASEVTGRREEILESVDSCLVWTLSRGDLDLACELILTRLLMSPEITPLLALGINLVESAWRPDETLPPDQEAAVEDGDDAEARTFFECYHTTFVAAILGAVGSSMALDAVAFADESPDATGWAPSDFDDLTGVLTGGTAQPGLLQDAWSTTLGRGIVPGPHAVQLHCDALLIGAVRGYDLATLVRLLIGIPSLVPRATSVYAMAARFLQDQRLEQGDGEIASDPAGSASDRAEVARAALLALSTSRKFVASSPREVAVPA